MRKTPVKTNQKLDSLGTSVDIASGQMGLTSGNFLGKKSLGHEAYQVPIIRKCVDYLPDRVAGLMPHFFGEENEDSNLALSSALEEIELLGLDKAFMYSWSSFWAEAHKLADIEGNSYVVIGTDKTTRESTIEEFDPASESITWLAVIAKNRVTTLPNQQIYKVTVAGIDNYEQLNEATVGWHHSRIVKLAGIRSLDVNQNNEDLPLVNAWLDAYQTVQEVQCSVVEMIRQHSFFVLKKDGLAGKLGMIAGKKEVGDWLQGIMSGIKNLGGLVLDKEREDASVVTRSYANLDKLITINIEWFVAHTGFPKSFILGVSDASNLSDASKTDLRKLADLVLTYQQNKHLPAIYNICAAKSTELGLGDIRIEFVSTYTPTPMEQAEVSLKESEARLKEIEVERAVVELERFKQQPLEQVVNTPLPADNQEEEDT